MVSSSNTSNSRRSRTEKPATQSSEQSSRPSTAKERGRRGDVIHSSSLGDAASNPPPGFGFDLESPISAEDYRAALEVERSRTDDALAVYVHLPFCPSRCLTCDNQTSISHDSRQIDRYIDALEREIGLVAESLGIERRLQQLHLGGGTPNYLSELQLVRLVDILDRHFTIDEHTETSLQANAHRASITQLALLHGLGFRSINLEVRDLDPKVQESLGRRQSLGVVRDVVESARAVGFTRVSTDLVFGLPNQSAASVRSTIEKLLSMEPDRVYCSAFARRPAAFQHQSAIDERHLPSLGDKVAIFSRIVEGLSEAGYDWIGLDCFARPEDAIARAHREGQLHRNWIGYTDQPGRSLIGFGSSAASDLTTVCARNAMTIDSWRDAIEGGQLAVDRGAILDDSMRRRRHALSDLMCNIQRRPDAATQAESSGANDTVLTTLMDDGLIAMGNEGVAVTDNGRVTLQQLWGRATTAALSLV